MNARVLTTLLVVAFAARAWGQDMKPGQSKADAQAEDPKARAIREAYEEQLRRYRQEVTIGAKNATVDVWNVRRDERSRPTVDAYARCKLPFRLEGDHIVARPPHCTD